MSYYVVTYDLLTKNEPDYAPLIEALESLGAVKYQKSGWFVELEISSNELAKILIKFLENGDRLMVLSFTDEPSISEAIAPTEEWIEKRFSLNAALAQDIME